ncbi:HesA/MoeB/ThiF family protein [Bacteroidia bacterium]|nr:HesA/MoeB/ThiF family protein [Bacteroidia bacterium]
MIEDRYTRQIALPQVGIDGQEKLKKARVLIVGAGGLGNAVLPYLASSGIGVIGVIDGDAIALSNLHRQVLFSEEDLNLSKSKIACDKLSVQFPDTEFEPYAEFLSGQNALRLFEKYDLIIDATDSVDARYLINDGCILKQKPFVHASIYRFQFQVAAFNIKGSGSYRCLYPTAPKNVQSCAEAGVLPTTVAMAGLYQANEVFKYFLGIGDQLTNKMLLIDTLSNRQDHFSYTSKLQGFITPDYFQEKYAQVKKIQFTETLHEGVFLDVRNEDEEPSSELNNSIKVPLPVLENDLSLLPKDKPIYIYCQSGKRSIQAYHILRKNNYKNVYCLHENANEINELKIKVG